MCGIKHGLFWEGSGFPAHVSVYANDGTVTVMQAGVEMGQGLFTKVHILHIIFEFENEYLNYSKKEMSVELDNDV